MHSAFIGSFFSRTATRPHSSLAQLHQKRIFRGRLPLEQYSFVARIKAIHASEVACVTSGNASAALYSG